LLPKNAFLVAPLRCALAFGRVELSIFKSLAARLKPCPDKHALPRVNRFFFMATA